jgi:hypothetical protein
MFRVVKYLCDSGVTPEAISKANGLLAARRLQSADAIIASREEFIAWLKAKEAAGGKPFDSSRFFCDDGELLHSGGKTWALSKLKWTPLSRPKTGNP